MISTIRIEARQPGDGVICHHTDRKNAADRVPCQRPVAVIHTEVGVVRAGGVEVHSRRRVVCALHFPGATSAGDISADARKAATERVLTAHWDDYQAALREETDTRLAAALEAVDESVRGLLAEGSTP
jgi:hypothetical protein